uniref:tRNA wybutosine-synthesizing protein 4 n=1 Tax=Clastoptera arizonana TaxID=38151 RepID=A0A1B6C0F6_9HEMI
MNPIIPIYENVTKEFFTENIQTNRKPAILRGVDIGNCSSKWTPEYLIQNVGDIEVKVHVSSESRLDFINKNFIYKTIKLSELIKRVSDNIKSEGEYFICPQEYYYLRSLSSERRGKEVADLKKQFPQLSNDIVIPKFFKEQDFFSSVLRIGSEGLQLWTHYDIMDNLLIQVHGKKRVVLFSPSDVNYLYLNGDKSEVLDIDNPNLEQFPDFHNAIKYECFLESGDIIFIPALWFHNTLSLTHGVAVNVFWKNLGHNLYDKNDFYGNKDLLPASKVNRVNTTREN